MTPKTCAYCSLVREHEGGEYSCTFSKGKFKQEVFTKTCVFFMSEERYKESLIEAVENAMSSVESASADLILYRKESVLARIYYDLQQIFDGLENYKGGIEK